MQIRAIFFSLVFSFLVFLSVIKAPPLRPLLFRAATAIDSPALYYKLADCYDKGILFERDLVQAEQWYLKAAEHNHAKAMYKLGSLYSHREGMRKGVETIKDFWNAIPLDLPLAIKWYKRAAALGYVSAYVRLGYFNIEGIGIPVDYKQSFQWYRKAAKTGDSFGQDRLGYFYSHGLDREQEWIHLTNCWDGIKNDYQKALKWYLRSANQGHKNSQYLLGFMYSHGTINADQGTKCIDNIDLEIPGIPLDYQEAIQWYTKAAEQGQRVAYRKLGYFYLQNNEVVKKDPKKAFECWLQGAEKGDFFSSYRVGICYEQGIGVPQNDNKALEWFTRAANEGEEYSEKYLEDYAQNAAMYFTRAVVGDSPDPAKAEMAERIRADLYKTFKSQGIVFPYSNPTAF